MKIQVTEYVNARTGSGRTYVAMQDTVSEFPNDDTEMLDLAHQLIANGQAVEVGDDTEQTTEEAVIESGTVEAVEDEADEAATVEAVEEAVEAVSLDSMTVTELQDVARVKGLTVGGTKAELIARIEAAE